MTPARLSTLGWILFAISGVLFLIPAVQVGDPLIIAGCVVWLVAIAIFLWVDWLRAQQSSDAGRS